jgi:hypothetical protein
MTLTEKLCKLRASVTFLKKDTSGYKYRYVSGAEVLGHYRPVMDELGIVLTTEVSESTATVLEMEDDGGKIRRQHIVSAVLLFTWRDALSDETLPVRFASGGQDADIAKAYGKMLTYGERYFWLKQMSVPTDDEDPDAEQGTPGEPGEFLMPMGKSKGTKLRDIPTSDLESARAWCESKKKFPDLVSEIKREMERRAHVQ